MSPASYSMKVFGETTAIQEPLHSLVSRNEKPRYSNVALGPNTRGTNDATPQEPLHEADGLSVPPRTTTCTLWLKVTAMPAPTVPPSSGWPLLQAPTDCPARVRQCAWFSTSTTYEPSAEGGYTWNVPER